MSEEMDTIIDFSEDIATAEAPPPLPLGTYTADIRSAEAKVSNNTGNKYGDAVFYISPDQFPADYPIEYAPDGLSLHYRRIALEDTPAGRYRLRQFLEAIGAPLSSRIDMNDWIGMQAQVVIEHDEFDGIIRPNIVKVLADV